MPETTLISANRPSQRTVLGPNGGSTTADTRDADALSTKFCNTKFDEEGQLTDAIKCLRDDLKLNDGAFGSLTPTAAAPDNVVQLPFICNTNPNTLLASLNQVSVDLARSAADV